MESWPFCRDAGSCLVMLDHASCYDYLPPLNQQRNWLTMNMLAHFEHLKYTFIKISGMHGRVLVQTLPNYATVFSRRKPVIQVLGRVAVVKAPWFFLSQFSHLLSLCFLCESICFAFRRKSFQDKKKPSAERRRPTLVFPCILVVCVQPASSTYAIQVLHNWKVHLRAGSKGWSVEHNPLGESQNLLVRQDCVAQFEQCLNYCGPVRFLSLSHHVPSCLQRWQHEATWTHDAQRALEEEQKRLDEDP